MTEYFFTADTHFGHANIIRYCDRPFKTIGEMDVRLVQLWNERVKPEDIVFHIGDFCFKTVKEKDAEYYTKQLNGNIIFLQGNHDSNNGLKTCIQDIRIYLGGKNILLIHNPNETSYGFDICLSGHVHQKWKYKTMNFHKMYWDVINVGVDVWNFRPINIQEIIKDYEDWKKKQSLYTT